jgi:hypothetical protein
MGRLLGAQNRSEGGDRSERDKERGDQIMVLVRIAWLEK